MSEQLNYSCDNTGPEIVQQVAAWLDQCGRSAIGQESLGLCPAALLFTGLRTALLDGREDDVHPVLVGAVVSALEADPSAVTEMRVLFRDSYRPGWRPLLAALTRELVLAEAEGRRRVDEARRAAEGFDDDAA